MNHDDLRHWSRRAADWAHDYHATLRDRPVRAQTTPGATAAKLPAHPPEQPEPMDRIFADFEAIVPDAMTHWQHPRFFAYFPANAAPASMLAEQLANAIAAQCMLWQTSPAATEIEQVMIDWLRQALGLAGHFTGTIHDSATTCTLSAMLTMRERALDWSGLQDGLSGGPRLRIYASAQTHSSIDKAVRIAGIGQANLVKVPTAGDFGMDPAALDAAIRADLAAGHTPAGVVLCVGGTSIGASDPIAACLEVAKAHGLYTHVDAAWAGSAMICPEFRALLGRRRPRRQHRLQPAQMARRAVRLCGAVPCRSGAAGAHAGPAPRLPADAGPGRGHQFQRMDRAAGPPVPGAETVVHPARLRAGGAARADPQPRRLDRRTGRGIARHARYPHHDRTASGAVHLPVRARRAATRTR